jgi:hypothetical protein
MVERFFRDLTENQLRRGVFTSVEALQERILAYIQEHNRQPKPFIWTAKANDILEKVKRAKANLNNSPICVTQCTRLWVLSLSGLRMVDSN